MVEWSRRGSRGTVETYDLNTFLPDMKLPNKLDFWKKSQIQYDRTEQTAKEKDQGFHQWKATQGTLKHP